MHERREHVLRAHQAAVEEGEAGDRHHQHERGAGEHPGGVAGVELRRRGRRGLFRHRGRGTDQSGEATSSGRAQRCAPPSNVVMLSSSPSGGGTRAKTPGLKRQVNEGSTARRNASRSTGLAKNWTAPSWSAKSRLSASACPESTIDSNVPRAVAEIVAQSPQHLPAVDAGHLQVEDQRDDVLAIEDRPDLAAVVDGNGDVTLVRQRALQDESNRFVVVGDEYDWRLGLGAG